jgi:type II secretory pathway component HofQ
MASTTRNGRGAAKRSTGTRAQVAVKRTKKIAKARAKREKVSLPAARRKELAPPESVKAKLLSAGEPRDAAERLAEILNGPLAAAREENAVTEVQAEFSRMISELNEVRMRLDAIVRKLAHSAFDAASCETTDEIEQLRMRLLSKLDRVREGLVRRLSEERVAARDR